MDNKKIKSFVTSKSKEIATNYNSLMNDEEYIPFVEASLEEYIGQDKQHFSSTFTEFGETFTTEYDVIGILNNTATYKIYQAVVAFSEEKNEKHYKELITAYYYNLLTQIKCLKENKLEESIFSADITLSLIFSAAYYPEDITMIADYLLMYLKEKDALVSSKTYEILLGKSELFPLAVFLIQSGLGNNASALQNKATQISKYISTTVQPAYTNALAKVDVDDEQTVKDWVDELADYHIQHSKDDWTQPFNHIGWQYFPVEIIALLKLRLDRGKTIDFIDNPLVVDFIPFLKLQVTPDKITQQLKERVKGS